MASPSGLLSVDDFAAKIKAKYPDYASIDNATLVQKIVEKHPEYKSVVNLAPAQQPAQTEQPGFFKRLGQSLGIPTSQEELQAIAPKNLQDVADLTLGGPAAVAQKALQNYAETAGRGIKEGVQEGYETGQQLGRGEITPGQAAGKAGHAAMHTFLQGIPIIGPSIETAGEDIQQGNVRGAAGGLTGVIGQVAAPEIVKRGAPLLKSGLASASERMYQSALKPSLAKNAPSPAALSKTGVEAGIPVSADGQVKLEGLISDLNDAISSKIKAGTQAGATIAPADIAKRLDTLKTKFSNQALPAEDLQTIEDAKQAFLKAHPSAIPLDEAQAIKQGTYQQLKGKYGQLSSARIEAEKSLARGIKEELQTQFPEIQGLNAQESKFINLDGALEKAVRRIGNHQLIGIGTPIVAGAVGGTAGGPAGVAAGILKAVIDDPVVKSTMAIALNKGGRGVVPIGLATSRIGSYSKALAQPQESEQ